MSTPIYDQARKAQAHRRHAILHSRAAHDAAAFLSGAAFLGFIWVAYILWTVQ